MFVTALETPAVVVDLDVVEKNLRRCQDYMNQHGLALRPHIKTHKIPSWRTCRSGSGRRALTARSSAKPR